LIETFVVVEDRHELYSKIFEQHQSDRVDGVNNSIVDYRSYLVF